MVAEPTWYKQLRWSSPITLENLRHDRNQVTTHPGLYAFHLGYIDLAPDRVLYVGEAGNLQARLRSYTIDYMTAKTYARHRGRLFLFSEHAENPFNVYVRWVVYGGHRNELEASLIHYLKPIFNIRDEEARHGILDDRARLDRRFLL